MAVFKCKMCGGTLSVQDGATVAECEYCGTKQTLPTSHDEVIVNLFNRANNLRLKSEFDKAAEVYDKILALDDTQAEAHWGVVLCKYGVEYVEDPLMDERIPTCHRTQMESILSDAEYLAVLQYADSVSRPVYEMQAREINELQKKILEIVKSEKPFDVFICYKETDDSRERTRDSIIANEIYHELTNSGLKVFYAAITLEDKLGQEYEPYIYAALTSAKVMLVLGTKPEYFNAVWVKNEWSRYLHLMKTDRQTKRTLIPCFRDMDAYDLPDEFSHLQALDMSSIAFMPDLTRNIQKLTGISKIPPVSHQNTESTVMHNGQSVQITSLLKRAFMLMEDREFNHANELLETVLNNDPENAKAYVGKFMAKHQIPAESEIPYHPQFLLKDGVLFMKALKYTEGEYLKTLLSYIYHGAEELVSSGSYADAAKLFEKISGYSDAIERVAECIECSNQQIYDKAFELMNSGSYIEASNIFMRIHNYKDSKEQAEYCSNLNYKRIYDSAVKLANSGSYLKAAKIFEGIQNYKDSKDWIERCFEYEYQPIYDSAVNELESGAYTKAEGIFKKLGNYKDAPEMAEYCQECEKQRIYDYAVNELESGAYTEAEGIFKKLGNYNDAPEMAEYCQECEKQRIYDYALSLAKSKEYYNAIRELREIQGFKNSDVLLEKCEEEIERKRNRTFTFGTIVITVLYSIIGIPIGIIVSTIGFAIVDIFIDLSSLSLDIVITVGVILGIIGSFIVAYLQMYADMY